jgi:hypothetical protein
MHNAILMPTLPGARTPCPCEALPIKRTAHRAPLHTPPQPPAHPKTYITPYEQGIRVSGVTGRRLPGTTYKEMTHRVTFCPCCKHFSGLGSARLQSRNALFCAPHLALTCFDADINTAEVVIGAPSTSDSAMAPATLRSPPCLASSPPLRATAELRS